MKNTYKLTEDKLYQLIENTVRKFIKEIDETTVYHNSEADFNEFDLAYVNTGTKNQAYGWGIYLSYTPEGAEYYGSKQYTVEIPSEDKKYLFADKEYSRSFMSKIIKRLYKRLMSDEYGGYKSAAQETWAELQYMYEVTDGLNIYGTISSYLGSDKAASEFLYSLGIIGLRFNATDTDENVVMFNPKDIKILNKK